MTTGDDGLVLAGIDGSNPLGFLAALGTLRSLSAIWPDHYIRLSWQQASCWRPQLHITPAQNEDDAVSALAKSLAEGHTRRELNVGDDLTLLPQAFRSAALEASKATSRDDRSALDFLVAFGCEATITDNGQIQDTAFRTMAGAGHQHFLAFMRNIAERTSVTHLFKTLFEPWRYDDPVQNATLRWDPIDDVRYALRWRDPSGDPVRRNSGSMLGANRLAIEALPLFPTAPRGQRLLTTGFRGEKASNTYFTWPIWEYPASLDVVRSLVALPGLQEEHPQRTTLGRFGIAEVFRSQRITTGKVRNFTQAQSVRGPRPVSHPPPVI